jgi:cytochrome b6-f complex iron-sulfur subunit
MDATAIFVIGIVAAAVLAAAGIFAVAARRGPQAEPITGELDRAAARRDRRARRERVASAAAVATLVEEAEQAAAPEAEEEAPPPDPLLDRIEVTPDEMGINRRKFLNRSLVGLFAGAFLGGQAIAYLAFLWPKLKGGFGTAITVGNAAELRSQIVGAQIVPFFFAAAQSYIVPFDPDDLAGSSFAGLPVVAGGGGGEVGLMALWQKCVHLGCRVPECIPSQGFECPCHGSRYNFHGEYEAGPAPRNLDRFEVGISDAGDLVVNTGNVFQTARSKVKTIAYPQGPSCI